MKKKPNSQQFVNFTKNAFEINAWANNSLVVGIDEVGRGCLAGPLVTAAVILPANCPYPYLRDSKVMSPQERDKAFKWIKKHCWFGIGIVHNRIIDKHNIWQSTLIAMKKALMNVLEVSSIEPSAILVDAMPLCVKDTHIGHIPVHFFNYGESLSMSIAAASIVAKVTRDALMASFNSIIPGYTLVNNKGYATIAHTNAVKKHSYSVIHRLSFLKKIHSEKTVVDTQLSFASLDPIAKELDNDTAQHTLCGSD